MAHTLSASAALDWAFAQPRTAKLATVTASGAPHVAPVWVARDGDRIVFNTGAGTMKGRAIARDPRVSMCFDDEAPPFSFVLVQGTAKIVEDHEAKLKWATAIGGRYMGHDVAEQFGIRNAVPGELLVVVTPTRIIGQTEISD